MSGSGRIKSSNNSTSSRSAQATASNPKRTQPARIADYWDDGNTVEGTRGDAGMGKIYAPAGAITMNRSGCGLPAPAGGLQWRRALLLGHPCRKST